MIYKFKSKASGDVIMLAPQGDQVLRVLGREPSGKGILEVADMPAALAALAAAMLADESAGEAAAPTEAELRVALRQRAWPLVEMIHRAQAAKTPIVWGV